jgi:hypothetical protein
VEPFQHRPGRVWQWGPELQTTVSAVFFYRALAGVRMRIAGLLFLLFSMNHCSPSGLLNVQSCANHQFFNYTAQNSHYPDLRMKMSHSEIELIPRYYSILIYDKNEGVFLWQKRLET